MMPTVSKERSGDEANRGAHLTLTKRQVAREEIETAIDLAFTEGSVVAAHLLGWAAVDVLRGVAALKGKQTFFELMETRIRPEKIKLWWSVLRTHYTFAKHSDRDPDVVVEDFNPRSTEMVLLAAITDYGTVYKQLTIPMYLFRGWIFAQAPQLLIEGAADEIIPGVEKIFGIEPSFHAARTIYREFMRDRDFYLRHIPEERRDNVEI